MPSNNTGFALMPPILLKFEGQFGIPVFIAIGIGGTPSSPERLFVTPLQNIANEEWISEKQLIRYNRKTTHKFYYDYTQQRLF
ncbi:MAG: hypothetical protein EOO88_63225 [Pedobacter sp.]|nr:MAG: hypothetical protein EOO88_63225 [Pedobacter sp.]